MLFYNTFLLYCYIHTWKFFTGQLWEDYIRAKPINLVILINDLVTCNFLIANYISWQHFFCKPIQLSIASFVKQYTWGELLQKQDLCSLNLHYSLYEHGHLT